MERSSATMSSVAADSVNSRARWTRSARASCVVALTFVAACSEEVPPGFRGVRDDVTVTIDTLGIPHILGKHDADVLFAAGYMVASERLDQLDWTRRRALGRLAEVFGEEALDDDELARWIGFAQLGRADRARVRAEHPEDDALMVAWVAGVNARIEEVLAGCVPLLAGFTPEFVDFAPERWKVEDTYAIAKMFAFGSSDSLEYELLTTILERFEPDVAAILEVPRPATDTFAIPAEDNPHRRTALRHAPRRPLPANVDRSQLEPVRAAFQRLRRALAPLRPLGSNNWAVAGVHTADGRPLLAGDPHQPLRSPSLMYAQHLRATDGTLDVLGFGFVGTPGVQLGHNAHVGWTATTTFADAMDVLDVARTADGQAVRLGGVERRIERRRETIVVRNAARSGTTSHEYIVEEVPGVGRILPTTLSPIPLARPNGSLLLQWTGLRPTIEVHTFFAIARARSVDEFERAVDTMQVGGFNFVAADRDMITYRVHTDVPDRGDPSSRPMPTRVVDGDDPRNLWSGAMLSADQLPRARAPSQGYLVTANNDPWGFTANGTVEDDPFYYGAFFDPGFRAARAEAELATLVARGGVTRSEMQSLQLDVESLLASRMLTLLEAAAATVDTDPALESFRGRAELRTALASLRAWDRRLTLESTEAPLFHAFAHLLASRVLGDDLEFLFDAVLEANPIFVLKATLLTLEGAYPNTAALAREGKAWLLLSGLSDAVQWYESRREALGRPPTWGEVHGVRFDNPYGGRLDGGFTATPGGEDTLNVASSTFYDDRGIASRWESTHGPIYRMVIGFDEDGTPRADVTFPRGQSGDPESPHFADTLADWVAGAYRPLAFRAAEIAAARESTRSFPRGSR